MAEQNDKMAVRSSSTSPFPYIVNSKTLSTSAVCEHCEKLKSTVQQAYQQSLDSSQCLYKAGGCYRNKLRLQLPRARMKLEWCYECLSCDFKSYYLEDVEKHSVCHNAPVVCDTPVKSTDASGKRSGEPAVPLVILDTPSPPQPPQSPPSPIVANNCDDKKNPKVAKVLLFDDPASPLDVSSAAKSPLVPLKKKRGRPKKPGYDQKEKITRKLTDTKKNAHKGGDNERPTLTCGINGENPYANRNVEKRALAPVNTKILVLPSADTKNLARSLRDAKKDTHSDGEVEKGVHPDESFTKKPADQECVFPSECAKKHAPTKKRDPVREGRGSGKHDQLSETCSVSLGGDVTLQSSLAQPKDTPPSSSTVVAVPKTSIVSTSSSVVPNGNADHELRSPRSSIDLSKFSDLLGLKEVRQSNPNGANQVASKKTSASTEESVDVLNLQTNDSHFDGDLSPHRKSNESRVRLPDTHTAPLVEGQPLFVSVIKQDVNEQEPNSLPTENANAVETTEPFSTPSTLTYTMEIRRTAPLDKPQPVFVLQPTMPALTSPHESTNAGQPIPASDDKPGTVTVTVGSPTTTNQSPATPVASGNSGAMISSRNEQSKADKQRSASDDRQNTTDGEDSAVNVPGPSSSNDRNSATTEQQNTDTVGQDITIADHSYSKADSNNTDNRESSQSQKLLENKSSSEKLASLPDTRQPVVVISPLEQTVVRRHEDEKMASHSLSKMNEKHSRPRKMTAKESTSARNKVVVDKGLWERSTKRRKRRKPSVTVDASKTEAIKSAFSVVKSPQQPKAITGSSLILPIPTAQPEVATNDSSTITGTSWHSPEPQQNVALPAPGSLNLQSPTLLPTCKLSPLHVSTDLPLRSAPEPIENESTSEEDESNPWPSPEDQDTLLDASALKTSVKHSSKRRSASAKKHTSVKQHGRSTPLLTFGRPLSTSLSRTSLSPHSSVRMSPRLKSSTRLTKEAAQRAVSTLKILRKTCNLSPSPVKLLETGRGLDENDKAVIRFVPDYATENIERRSRYFSENNPSGKSIGSGTDDEEDGSANVWPGPVLSDEEYRDHSLVHECELADADAHIGSETESAPTTPERKRRKLVKFM